MLFSLAGNQNNNNPKKKTKTEATLKHIQPRVRRDVYASMQNYTGNTNMQCKKAVVGFDEGS